MLFSPSGKKSHIFARVGLTLALVINLTLPVSASDLTTGSAFAVDERLLSVPRLAAAAAPVGSSTDPYYVRPFTNGSATVYRYSWSQTNPNGSSSGTNQTFTNFADIVTHITSSIANSFLALGQRLHYDNDAIFGRLYDIFSSSKSNGSVLNSILSAIQSIDTFDTVKIADNSSNGFSKSYLWGKYAPVSTSDSGIWWFDGRSKLRQSFDASSNSLFAELQYRFILLQSSMSNYFANVVGNIGSYSLTNSDLTSTNLSANSSIANDMRNIGANLSDHLAHLRFVLANDEDIALRQSQHDNMQSVKNDFTSGDISVSPSKLGGLKSVGSALTDGFSSSASVSDGLSVLGSGSDAWSWFSDENAQSFDSVSGSRNMRMLKSGTSYLDQYYRDVMPYVN